jgi:hypothetical protein
MTRKNSHHELPEEVIAVLECSPNLEPCKKFYHANIYLFADHMKNDKCRQCIAWFRQADKELNYDEAAGRCFKVALECWLLPLHSTPSAPMFNPIAVQEFDEQKYREFLTTLSNDELIRTGKELRSLSGDGKIVTTTPSAFYKQLKICREEYRRRHPKAQ